MDSAAAWYNQSTRPVRMVAGGGGEDGDAESQVSTLVSETEKQNALSLKQELEERKNLWHTGKSEAAAGLAQAETDLEEHLKDAQARHEEHFHPPERRQSHDHAALTGSLDLQGSRGQIGQAADSLRSSAGASGSGLGISSRSKKTRAGPAASPTATLPANAFCNQSAQDQNAVQLQPETLADAIRKSGMKVAGMHGPLPANPLFDRTTAQGRPEPFALAHQPESDPHTLMSPGQRKQQQGGPT